MKKLSEEFLSKENLLSQLNEAESSNLKLLWSDWDQLCQRMHENVINGDTAYVEKLTKDLESLKKTPLWVRGVKGSIKTNLYDYYQYYMDPRVRTLWQDLHKNTLVSLVHEAGPYVHIQSMRWLDQSIYLKFVQLRLLQGTEAKRSFRLRCQIPGKVIFNENPLDSVVVSVSSINRGGVLFEVQGKGQFMRLTSRQQMQLDLDLDTLKNDKFFKQFSNRRFKKDLSFKFSPEALRSESNIENAKFSDGSTYFLFLPFDKLDGDYGPLLKAFENIEQCMTENIDKLVA